MRRFIVLVLFFVGLASAGFGQVVEVEHVLDAPPKSDGFLGDSAVYTKDGTLLFLSSLAANVFVLRGEEWVPLVREFQTPEYNLLQEPDVEWWSYYSDLVNSKKSDEYLFFVSQRPHPQENYRIYTSEDGTIRAEWVSQEYYEANKDGRNLGRPWDGPWRINLRNGVRLMLQPEGDGAHVVYPEIVDADGQTLFRVSDRFREGFVEDLRSFTINPALDRVAMVVSFRPERTSPYYTPAMPRLKKLVILKINYDQKAEENPPQPILEEPEEKRVEAPKVSSPEAEWWPPGYITEDNVRLRTAPNLEGKILRLLKRGEKVTVLAMDPTPMGIGEHTANWYKVRTEGGDVGWMYGWYLSWTPYPRTPSADELKPKAEPEGRD